MEKMLARTPVLKAQNAEVLQEYTDLDHFETKAEKVSSFFLPHHAIVKPESKNTNVRVVLNASKKTGSGFSLNYILY